MCGPWLDPRLRDGGGELHKRRYWATGKNLNMNYILDNKITEC